MSEKDSSSSSGLSGGAIAGVVVGSLGGLAAIIAIFFLIFFKKRQARSTSPSPSVSNGLLDGRNSKGSQMSVANRAFSDTHSHTLSAGSSRLPTFTDTRLKTDTVLYAGGRRDSDVSLQDNEDYSRPVLRVSIFLILWTDCLTRLTLYLAYEPRLIRSTRDSGYFFCLHFFVCHIDLRVRRI